MSEQNEACDLTGRTAVILGASSAIGDAIAMAFATAGARVALADVATEGMQATRGRLDAAGHDVSTTRVDVTRRDEVDGFIDGTLERFGGVDVVANIAGVIHDATVVEMRETDLDRVLAVNQKGVFFGCQSAARVMRERGGGSIINMASLGAYGAIPMLSAYAMSKAAVVALTRVLAAEVGRDRIRVNAVAPGYVEGGMTTRGARLADGSLDEDKLAATREKARRRTALGITGTPEDIAQIFLFLASDASRYVTGQVIHANGGSHMP